jgi:ABC-2 type transport system ATP-binding protein
VIELRRLQKVEGRTTVVDVEGLDVGAGEIVAVVGPVGSGKLALLALLTGRSRPTAGTVRVAGLDPSHDRDELSQQVGVLFTENTLYERLAARDNLLFHCRLRGLPAARADQVLTQVGLTHHAAVLAKRLPPGLARRLALGCAILHRPAVLILMESFAGCDADSCALLARLVRRLAGDGAAVLILATEAAGLSDLCLTIHRLERGRVVRTYDPREERQAELPFKVPARLEGRVALVDPADILYASAGSGRTSLYTVEGPIPTHFTLAELEERLARSGFFRAHRGYLVNLQRVKAVIPYTRNSFTLVLDDAAGAEIPLSKSAARELRELLGY